MGMDVWGKNPKNSEGNYFRANCWTWRPLWEYVSLVGNLTEDETSRGHYNDGFGLDDKRSIEIAKKLEMLIDSGAVKRAEEDWKKQCTSLPKQECNRCNGTGKFGSYKCLNCRGSGKRENEMASYFFDEHTVKEFKCFLLNCGGFEIH